MDSARKGARFEEVAMPHLNAAYNLARWLTRNNDDADDAVQEAYLRAYRAFETFQGGDARAWLLAIVRNTCYTSLRGKGAWSTDEFDERLHIAVDPQPDVESALVNQAALGSLNGCIEALPAEFREAIVLRELQEMSYKAISDVTRAPVGTVMSRISRARKRLQECMERAVSR